MRTLGLLGGMSWESTVPYYREINRAVGDRLGGFHSAPIVLWSVDFAELEALVAEARWSEVERILADRARRLEAAGAELLVLCTNTMHRAAPALEAAVSIPLLHIVDAVASSVLESGCRTVGLLGTRFTMNESFYRERLELRHGIEVLVPDESQRAEVDRVIYQELVRGELRESSRRDYAEIIEELAGRGANGVILGCTEIGLLIGDDDVSVPLFDSAVIHARRAAELALAEPRAG